MAIARKSSKKPEEALSKYELIYPTPGPVLVLKSVTKMMYTFQKERIQTENQLRALGDRVEPEHRAVLEHLAERTKQEEKLTLKTVKEMVQAHPIWDAFFEDVSGAGEVIAAVCITTFVSSHRYETASQMWAHAGLAVVHTCTNCGADRDTFDKDGVRVPGGNTVVVNDNAGILGDIVCRSCVNDDNGSHSFQGRAQRKRRGHKINWDPWAQAKLLGVLGSGLLKAGASGLKKLSEGTSTADPEKYKYAKLYYDERDRLLQCPCSLSPAEHKKRLLDATPAKLKKELKPNGCTNGHMHRKATRKMVKYFVLDLHKAWRQLEGLPVRPPYAEQYLGKTHHA